MRHTPWQWNEAAIRETSSYCAVQTWLEEATQSPGLWLLVGPPGVGKTFGAVAYAARESIPYICVPPATESVSALARELCAAIGVADGNPVRALYAHCESAQVRLIIDEAARLNRPQFELVRDLSDRYPISAVFIGTDTLPKKLVYYDTIVHRIAGVFSVPPLTLADLRLLLGDTAAAETAYKRTKGNWRYICRILERLENYPAQTPGIVHEIAEQVILDPARFKMQKGDS
jgi:replication-associated recombination protein RarA